MTKTRIYRPGGGLQKVDLVDVGVFAKIEFGYGIEPTSVGYEKRSVPDTQMGENCIRTMQRRSDAKLDGGDHCTI